jgi:DNA-binding NarL/FixJ family response regulator
MTCPDVGTQTGSRAESAGRLATLPAQRVPDDPGRPVGPDPTPPAHRAGHVVFIDPDPAASEPLAHAVSATGMSATVAPDATSVARIEPLATDIAVVNLRVPAAAPETVRALRSMGWRRIIAVSSTAEVADILAALDAGATSALVTGHAAPSGDVPTGIYDLSPREVEVLRMVADGRSNKWIGERLDLSALTVKSHLARIGRKLGTGDRAHMVALALRAGVIS